MSPNEQFILAFILLLIYTVGSKFLFDYIKVLMRRTFFRMWLQDTILFTTLLIFTAVGGLLYYITLFRLVDNMIL